MAKQVFLSQLAAGLMAGTTRKRGIGGALEVFGQALGPAVNNYAVMKLKENELENELMSDALEMSSDFLKAQNAERCSRPWFCKNYWCTGSAKKYGS